MHRMPLLFDYMASYCLMYWCLGQVIPFGYSCFAGDIVLVHFYILPTLSDASALQISCAWGFTTTGGAKGVGESTTSAVVISLVMIFVADFVLSFLFFQGQGDALKQLK
eukprot:GHRR01028662.1.p1 GENE.GHRR01028662.1~~GHRR01028662.1.p1  ORF type:complete len:109 (-),score=31.47 GHRR01028662.1:1739-2065(-)